MQALVDLLAGRRDDLQLDRAALLLARVEYPDLEIEPYIRMLDGYAVELAGRLGECSNGFEYVEAANEYLFAELGFTGNSDDYYDPRNSCLNEVLERRTGIPITLAVVYMEIARRLAKPVCGIGLPGHFVAQYRDREFAAFIDAFHGGRLLTASDCFDLARQALGAAFREDLALLRPATKRQILARMVHNLRAAYLGRRAYRKALDTLNLLLEADPAAAEEYKQRGMLHVQKRNLSAARSDLETYLRMAPQASDRQEIEEHLKTIKQYLAGLN
jgi:regulator of sirC expression with transglutaminase-like and TPR domain